MTSEERRTLEDLSDYMAVPLAEQDDDSLVAGYHAAARSADLSADYCRRFLVELKARHSWAELVKLTGDAQSTLYNRANPRRVRPAETPAKGADQEGPTTPTGDPR